MRRAAGAATALACAAALVVLVSACPGRASQGSAEPAEVQIDWPDAAPQPAPVPRDAG